MQFTIFVLHTRSGIPLEAVGPNNVSVHVNSSVTFGCRTITTQYIHWQFKVAMMIFDGANTNRFNNEKYGVVINTDRRQSDLTIKSARVNDSGHYQCADAKGAEWTTFTLLVNGQCSVCGSRTQAYNVTDCRVMSLL